jgi:hypothetical protein
LVEYCGYIKSKYFDKISGRYSFVDIFELKSFHVPLDFEKIKYFRGDDENIDQTPPITPSGQNGQVIELSSETYFADQQGGAADHIVLPVQLEVRRFRFASNEDLQLLEEESNEEGITFVGSIPNIAPTREILEKTGEDMLIHQATSDRDEQVRQMTDANGTFLATDPEFYYNYIENFTPVGPCGHYECGICYGSLNHYDKPQWFYIGLPVDDKRVTELRLRKGKEQKLKHLWKLAKLNHILLMSLEVADSIDVVDSPNLDDYYDSLQ